MFLHGNIFFFNDTATTEIYTLSLHDALPILGVAGPAARREPRLSLARSRKIEAGTSAPDLPCVGGSRPMSPRKNGKAARSEEHTSELQSRQYLVCRLLLEKKEITG